MYKRTRHEGGDGHIARMKGKREERKPRDLTLIPKVLSTRQRIPRQQDSDFSMSLKPSTTPHPVKFPAIKQYPTTNEANHETSAVQLTTRTTVDTSVGHTCLSPV